MRKILKYVFTLVKVDKHTRKWLGPLIPPTLPELVQRCYPCWLVTSNNVVGAGIVGRGGMSGGLGVGHYLWHGIKPDQGPGDADHLDD